MSTVVCFGEVLWDVFPTHKKIGGAPLNVALRLKSFGVDAHIISRIGNDKNGRELTRYVVENELDNATIQIDTTHKTGEVNVTLDSKGSATYEIAYPVSWDKIEVDKDTIELVKKSDAFIFGSLACRDAVSKESLLSLLNYASFKVFDVNLRPPHYRLDVLVELMKIADFIKCNDEELTEICNALGYDSNEINDQIRFLSKKTNTKKICVTKGGDGAILYLDDTFYTNRGYKIIVADTVGAGDSFLASIICKYLDIVPPQEALNFATALGALIASKAGANPSISIKEMRNLIEN